MGDAYASISRRPQSIGRLSGEWTHSQMPKYDIKTQTQKHSLHITQAQVWVKKWKEEMINSEG